MSQWSQPHCSTQPPPSMSQSRGMSQSQTHGSQQRNTQSSGDVEEDANDIVLFILNMQKTLKPVKKTNIAKHFKRVGGGKYFTEVMARVKKKLDDVFGLKLIEKEYKNVHYYLVNGLTEEMDMEIEIEESYLENHKMVLLLIILCVIYKNGGRLKEEFLLQFLKNADFIVSVEKPIGKGLYSDLDVGKFLHQELTSMTYLNYNEIESDIEEKTYEYSWGDRAELEIRPESIEDLYLEIEGESEEVEEEAVRLDSDCEVVQ